MRYLLLSFGFLAGSLVLEWTVATEPEAADDAVVQMVVELLGDKDKELRALGQTQVREGVKGQAATKKFVALLPKLTPEAQIGLLSALADRGDTAARPAVSDMLQSDSEEVRIAAIRALGKLGETANVRSLIARLSAASEAEKTAARASLICLSGQPVPAAIAAEMKTARPPLRVTLIEILSSRRATEVLPDLLAAAVDADPKVRTAAMTALGALADPQHIGDMVPGVLKAEKGAERETAEKAVMFACNRIADPEKRAEPLMAAMAKLSAADRITMLPTVGRIGGVTVLKIVDAAIADPTPSIHEAGLRALCRWPSASIAPRLIELAEKDPHRKHRAMALAALIRVAPLPDQRSAKQKLELIEQVLAMCLRDKDRNQMLRRTPAVRDIQTLRLLVSYLDKPAHAQAACEGIVELAHHRGLREPDKDEFDKALDRVIKTSKNVTVVERARRYKKGQTWVRPATPER